MKKCGDYHFSHRQQFGPIIKITTLTGGKNNEQLIIFQV